MPPWPSADQGDRPPTHRADPAAPVLDPLLGTVVDGIKLVRRLGAGSYGTVYEGRGDRDAPIVAVKVMHPHIAHPGLVRRFEYEAEILARLDHPGIARVHRLVRTVVQGVEVPCIVMEIVPGAKPITQYAGDLHLSVRDRVALVAQAAEAIGHGHRHGVLHRDVKPGNILVGIDGRAKVIDYGWARGADAAATLGSAHTVVGVWIGTWQYMSPEQLEGDPAAVDLRADVYALGAILQELLTGRPPHEFQGGPILAFVAKVRDTPPAPIPPTRRDIGRDLRAIIATCLAKDRNRRYSTAADLAADLRRHLAGEPIAPSSTGLRESITYLARKHTAAVAAAGVSALALLAATVGITIFSWRAERALEAEARTAAGLRVASARAEEEAARAQDEADNARRQLYIANLHRLAAPDTGRAAARERLFRDTVALVDTSAAADRDRGLPLELLCLRPGVIQPIAIVQTTSPADVRALAASPDGERIAIGARDGSVTLADAAGNAIATLHHDGPVSRVVLLGGPRRTLVSAAADGMLRFADAATGATRTTLDLGSPITDLAASADCSLVAAGCKDGSVRLMTIAADGVPGSPCRVRQDAEAVAAVAVAPAGDLVAVVAADGAGTLLDPVGGEPRATFACQRGQKVSIAFSPDGGRLAFPALRQGIGLLDTRSHAVTVHPASRVTRVTALAFSPDGRTLASASHDGTAVLHDAGSGTPTATLSGHRGRVTSLAFRPDGHTIATASADRSIRLWTVVDGTFERALDGHADRVDALAWAADGTTLVSSGDDGQTLLWDGSDDPGALEGHRKPVDGVAFIPGGTRVVSWSGDGSARLWDAATQTEIRPLPARREPITAGAVSPDGSTIALGGNDDLVILHDAADGRHIRELRGHSRRVTSIDFSLSGALLASASDDGTARLWDPADGRCLHVLEGHSGPIVAVRCSADGSRVATASRDGTARIWSVAMDAAPIVLEGHGSAVRAVAFSPSGALVATGSDDGSARLWRTADGSSARPLRAGTSPVTRVAFAADGTRLVTGTKRGGLDLWDTATGAHVASLDGHTGEIQAIAVTGDGSRVATASSDASVRLWDVVSGAELAVLRGHRGPVLGLSISSDGRDLVTSSADRTLHVWSRRPGEVFDARRAAGLTRPVRDRLADVP